MNIWKSPDFGIWFEIIQQLQKKLYDYARNLLR